MGICVSCRRRDRKAPPKRAPGAAGVALAPSKGAAAELLPRRDPAMANSISNIKMTNPIKGIVSKRRKRYIKDGFNLDLAYITERLIAMGFPAEKLEGVYRNHIDEVYRFLEQMHKDHYRIYNLCSERSYDSNKFHQRVGRYAFEDHTPPKIELIQPFCEDVHQWLTADPRNVAAVHCKAGKGRTGTMVCCYLLYSGQKATAEEALKYYGNKRTHDEKGVTIPSQRRYVQYYAALVRSGLVYTATKVHIRELVMSPPPFLNGAQCGLELAAVQAAPKREAPSGCQEVRKHDGSIHVVLTQCTPLQGDVRVDVYNKPKMMMRKEKLFHFWFNTFFVTNCVGATKIQPLDDSPLETYKITLNKWELDDAHKDKQHKLYSENFKVELIVQKQPETSTFSGQCARGTSPPSSASSSPSPSPPSSDGEPDGHWDSGEHCCMHGRINIVNVPCDLVPAAAGIKSCAHTHCCAKNVVNVCDLGARSKCERSGVCDKNIVNVPCDLIPGGCSKKNSNKKCANSKASKNLDVTESSKNKCANTRGEASCVDWDDKRPCCKNVVHVQCDVTASSGKRQGCRSKNTAISPCEVAKGNSEKNAVNIYGNGSSTKDCKNSSASCKSGDTFNAPGLSIDVSCASNKSDTKFASSQCNATKCSCDNSRKVINHGDSTKQCACLSNSSQIAAKSRNVPSRLNLCEHHRSKNMVCICELPTHDRDFVKHTNCDTKCASNDSSNDDVTIPYARLTFDSQKDDRSPVDTASVDSQLSDRTDSSLANSQMSDFCHGPKLSNEYCQLSKNSERASSRLSSECCHRSMQLSSDAGNSAASNKSHNACKALDCQNIEIRSKTCNTCKEIDCSEEVFTQSCYEVGSRCLNRNAVSLDSYSKVCEASDDNAYKLWRNHESSIDMSTQASSNEIDDELGSAGNFTRSKNSSVSKETRSLLGKDKKKQKNKRDESNASGKIPKVSSDHTISDDSKKKYNLFNRKDEDGVSKPRLSLGDMRASWREFSGKWSEHRKKKDRDN